MMGSQKNLTDDIGKESVGVRPPKTGSEIPRTFILNEPLSPIMQELVNFTAGKGRHALGPIGQDMFEQVPKPPNEGIHERLEKALVSLEGLPSLPRMVGELNAILSDPLCSAPRVAAIIEKDPALTLQILRLVNSSFYNFPGHIDNLGRAVAILGMRQISAIAQSALMVKVFRGIPQYIVDMSEFIRHSIAVGIAARTLAAFCKISNAELAYMAGLLHDVGRLFLFVSFPEEILGVMVLAAKEKQALYESESRLMGMDHGVIGATIIRNWNLPVVLEKTCRYHHHPDRPDWDQMSDIIHLADVFVHAIECGDSGEWLVPKLQECVWDRLGMAKEQVSAILSETESSIDAFCTIIVKDKLGRNC